MSLPPPPRAPASRIASMCGHETLGDGLNKRSNHDRIEAEVRESLEIASRLGIPGLICFSGNRNAGQTDADAIEACAEGLRRVAPYAEAKGINLNLELLNSKVDHAGYQADHTAWGVAVCRKVGSPRVKLLYDIYHMQIMEGDVIRTIRENIAHIGHFHTAGNPDRKDLDDTQELNYVGHLPGHRAERIRPLRRPRVHAPRRSHRGAANRVRNLQSGVAAQPPLQRACASLPGG